MVARWTQTWLSGPGSGGATTQPDGPRGARLGLPTEGAGSAASLGRRCGAFAIDALGSALVAGVFTAPAAPRNWSLLVFVLEYLVFTGLFGQTPGMRLCRLRVVRLDSGRPLGLWRALVRTLLLVALVPALISDRDGRGLHDKAVQSVVVAA